MCRFGQIVLRHGNVSRLLGGDGGCGVNPPDGECDRNAGRSNAQRGARELCACRCRDAGERM
ncbi:hypothetical protein BSLA_02r1739 [Burkholderia stabilis]|nr:hypothetical protein BSLA_02r1739 [Burkholderia stabilis]